MISATFLEQFGGIIGVNNGRRRRLLFLPFAALFTPIFVFDFARAKSAPSFLFYKVSAVAADHIKPFASDFFPVFDQPCRNPPVTGNVIPNDGGSGIVFADYFH